MNNAILGPFTVQPSGDIGQEICDPEGRIIAWTTDEWVAQVLVKLLNENEHIMLKKERNEKWKVQIT